MEKVAEIENVEKEKMKEKVDKIIAHKINVFINRQLIYNWPEQVSEIQLLKRVFFAVFAYFISINAIFFIFLIFKIWFYYNQ